MPSRFFAWARFSVGVGGAPRLLGKSAVGRAAFSTRCLRSSVTTININWESHRSCVLGPSLSQYSRAFEEVLKVQSAKHVEQKAFDGRVSHRGFPACVDCRSSPLCAFHRRPDFIPSSGPSAASAGCGARGACGCQGTGTTWKSTELALATVSLADAPQFRTG